jgi:SAM-dependent methyltransferase
LDAIRNQYQELGVDAYYEQHGSVYENPHFRYIEALLQQNESRIDYSNILDLCCGGGEVCMIIQTLGYQDFVGCDPFTEAAFERNLNQKAINLSFDDILKGKLNGQYSAIICSFAMHLCPEKQLFSLAFELFQHTKMLIVITPHKRPELENLNGISLDFEDFTLTERGKKVRLKAYRIEY